MHISEKISVGKYAALRLLEFGAEACFMVPGDFNLILLDELGSDKRLRLIGCCNELNAGFAANGYARVKGFGAAVCTLCVGGLALASAVAGAYADRTPVVFLSGTINSNDIRSSRIIHHTIGVEGKDQTLDMMRYITAYSTRITDPVHAAYKLDKAFQMALSERLPVYVEICCNLADFLIARPEPLISKKLLSEPTTNVKDIIVEIVKELSRAPKPILVIGPQLTQHGYGDGQYSIPMLVAKLLQTLPQLVIVGLPSAKSTLTAMVEEGENSQLGLLFGSRILGQLWQTISQPSIILHRLADAPDTLQIHLGVAHNDYVTLGGLHLVESCPRVIALGSGDPIQSRRLRVFGRGMKLEHEWPNVDILSFLKLLHDWLLILPDISIASGEGVRDSLRNKTASKIWYGQGACYPLPSWLTRRNELILEKIEEDSSEEFTYTKVDPIGDLDGYSRWLDLKSSDPESAAEPLRNRQIIEHWQAMLSKRMTMVVDTGDAWFMTQKLVLPMGCRYEIQMQYGSIGWSVGAMVGLAAAQPDRRIVGVVGDGAMQVAVQELSTLLRQRMNVILFVLNNGQYVIEELIHSGPYNQIQSWQFHSLVRVFEPDFGWGCRVRTEVELEKAILRALDEKDQLALIEIMLDPKDSTPDLLEFGVLVSAFNNRSV